MLQYFLIAVAALVGGIVTALLGWTETTEPFNPKKFTSSIIRSLIGAVVIAVAFDAAGGISPLDYLVAFLAGAGVDAGGKRVAGALAARLAANGTAKPLPPSETSSITDAEKEMGN